MGVNSTWVEGLRSRRWHPSSQSAMFFPGHTHQYVISQCRWIVARHTVLSKPPICYNLRHVAIQVVLIVMIIPIHPAEPPLPPPPVELPNKTSPHNDKSTLNSHTPASGHDDDGWTGSAFTLHSMSVAEPGWIRHTTWSIRQYKVWRVLGIKLLFLPLLILFDDNDDADRRFTWSSIDTIVIEAWIDYVKCLGGQAMENVSGGARDKKKLLRLA